MFFLLLQINKSATAEDGRDTYSDSSSRCINRLGLEVSGRFLKRKVGRPFCGVYLFEARRFEPNFLKN